LRTGVLTLLVVQNAVTALLVRWTRVPRLNVPMYYDSTAVLCTELIKIPMCAAMMLYTLGPTGALKDLREGFSDPKEILRLAVPAICYTMQNFLFYISLTALSASTYQVLSQTKTLATACFWVTMLGGRLVPRQWAALTILVAGVSAVQLDGVGVGVGATGSQLVGVAAVVCSSLLSGFANVYFEKLVKTTPTSIWVRNLQLCFFGVPQAMILMLKDSGSIATTGALLGFDGAVFTAVALKALGGLVVASTVKFADSLLKSFATAVSIIVTCLISIPLYRTYPSFQFVWGVALVIASLFMYNVPKPKKS
ncbi:nucleotide-sugar transporter-domain-containing protein, partial [Pavlovales sp. CCMP2436]